MEAHKRSGGSLKMWRLVPDLVTYWICGGSSVIIEFWWLIGDVVAQQSFGGSLEMWWLSRDLVAYWRCGMAQ